MAKNGPELRDCSNEDCENRFESVLPQTKRCYCEDCQIYYELDSKDDRIKELKEKRRCCEGGFFLEEHECRKSNPDKERIKELEAELKEVNRQRTIEQGAWEELDVYKEGFAYLKIKFTKIVGMLKDLQHQNHHTIEEEAWRIDKILFELKGNK